MQGDALNVTECGQDPGEASHSVLLSPSPGRLEHQRTEALERRLGTVNSVNTVSSQTGPIKQGPTVRLVNKVFVALMSVISCLFTK